MADYTGSVNWDLKIAGKELPDGDIVQFVVEKDLNQPDMAIVVLRNDEHTYTAACNHGDPFELKLNKDGKVLFKGEVAGLEPQYKAGGESRLIVRAFGWLHKALAGRVSKTFQDKSDKQIIGEVLGKSPTWKGPEITHKHVYQHNQSNLEFARLRAARLGCYLWQEGDALMVKRPELDKDSGIEFKIFAREPGEYRLKSFTPRMSTSAITKAVEVRGWNPETKELIVGKATAKSSPLGSSGAAAAAKGNAATETFTVDHPIWSKEEATAIAEARLQELSLAYITGEAEAIGNAAYQPSIVVKIVVKEAGPDKFNGKYLVTGVTHKYRQGGGAEGGYTTYLRLARDAESA
ncbi:MAG: contractile injection system protein, VgrG/Pvc8 family [Kofleriaceae bacterium]